MEKKKIKELKVTLKIAITTLIIVTGALVLSVWQREEIRKELFDLQGELQVQRVENEFMQAHIEREFYIESNKEACP